MFQLMQSSMRRSVVLICWLVHKPPQTLREKREVGHSLSSKNLWAIRSEEAAMSSGCTLSMSCCSSRFKASGNCFLQLVANPGVRESRITTASSRIGEGRLARCRISCTSVGDEVRRDAEDGMRLDIWIAGPKVEVSNVT